MTGQGALKPTHEGVARWPEAVQMWSRRAITIPLYFLLCALVLLLLPLFLLLGLIVDMARGSRGARARGMLFVATYLCCEVMGVAIAALAWLFSGVWMGFGHARFERWNFALEHWWARTLMAAAQRIYNMTISIEDDLASLHGPILLFIRHVSIGDTLLPTLLLSDRSGLNLRYVLKRELLWDPCLDIVGNRLPNYFARRGSGDSKREVAAVVQLMDGLGSHDGVLIYPEGTRFTARKRDDILARLRTSASPEVYARAAALRNVLPPRLGGPLGLLDHNRNADVVFLAHVGFEGSMDFSELLNGSLVDRKIRVGLWRVPFEEIPVGTAARTDWLFDNWSRMDRWVQAHQGRS